MLERVVERVNERELFKFSRMEPCGGMAEQTAVWKYDNETKERYKEIDFLAVLDYSPTGAINFALKHNIDVMYKINHKAYRIFYMPTMTLYIVFI